MSKPHEVQYIDWSDKGLALHDCGQGKYKYVTFEHWRDNLTDDIYIALQRETDTRKNLIIILSDEAACSLYHTLKERFDDDFTH